MWMYFFMFIIILSDLSTVLSAKNRFDRDGPLIFPTKPKESKSIKLICESSRVPMKIDHIHKEYATMIPHTFSTRCPEVYDYLGRLRQSNHMCTATNQNHSCVFRLDMVVITPEGALIDAKSKKAYSFTHHSIGMLDPIYYPGIHQSWSSYYEHHHNQRLEHHSDPNPYNLVVPTRMRWDDCFNHLSFQSVPFIAHVYEYHADEWDHIVWHASMFTAALLRLLDVPMHNIVINKQIIAKSVLLPWTSGWCPPQTSATFGIARSISSIMTRNLLHMHHITNTSMIPSYHNSTSSSPRNSLVLYLHRNFRSTRGVANSQEIISILHRYVNTHYQVIVVNHTMEYPSIEALHDSWYNYASLFSRAAVIIGPHGGAFNNIIWTRNDVHIIEFNEFPDDEHYTSSHGETPVRSVFLTAAWAKGITGKYYIIEPSMKHPSDMYTGKLRIAPYELYEVMKRIPKLMDSRYKDSKNPFHPERHGTWPQPNPDFTYVPPLPT